MEYPGVVILILSSQTEKLDIVFFIIKAPSYSIWSPFLISLSLPTPGIVGDLSLSLCHTVYNVHSCVCFLYTRIIIKIVDTLEDVE